MRVMLIVNPRAGRASGGDAAARAQEQLRGAGWEVTRRLTRGPGDAERLAREAVGEGYDAVFGCGGDGTLSQVLAGLLDTGVPGGVIPAGTGNDFCRTVGLSRDPLAAARQTLRGEATDIDLLELDGGRLWSVNAVGVGFDARVAARMNRRVRVTGGLAAYLTAVSQELVRHRPTEMRLRVDDARWEGQALLVAVANGRSYGAGMQIAPHALIDDGLLDVVLVGHLGRLEFLANFPKVLRGTHLTHPAVTTWRASEVAIETPEPSPMLVDGDVRTQTPVTVRVAPGRARFWMPGELEDT
ncbi:MAG: diacylglycerol kinase family protein [Armatimonadota bacterium]|nr:diacylglycerol kinase family protein [Armatimonadota bacterium]